MSTSPPPAESVKLDYASASPRHARNWLPLVSAGAIVAITLVAYFPAMRYGGFVWDDNSYVTENVHLQSREGLTRIWTDTRSTPQYYPLTFTTFWIEHRLWGTDPTGYHVVNVVLHATSSLLLWRVLSMLKVPGAWLAAAIFAVHPVHVESVAWITERKNVLSGALYMGAALAYLKAVPLEKDEIGNRQWAIGNLPLYFLSLACFILALFSKTVASSLPAAILLVIWWKWGRVTRRDVLPLLPFFLIGVVMGRITANLERTHVGADGPEWMFTFADRCIIAGRAVWFYARQLIAPMNLTFIYPKWKIDPSDAVQWLPLIGVILVVLVLWRTRERMGRGALVGVLFFIGTLFPALGFINLYPMRYSFVADHFQYLASIGLIVLFAAGVRRLIGCNRSLRIVGAVVLAALMAVTWRQSKVYADGETLWRDTIAKNPAATIAHNNLGLIHLNRGHLTEAAESFHRAQRLEPRAVEPYLNLAAVAEANDNLDEATNWLNRAYEVRPDAPEPRKHLARVAELKRQRAAPATAPTR